jgi:hypothetical protein
MQVELCSAAALSFFVALGNGISIPFYTDYGIIPTPTLNIICCDANVSIAAAVSAKCATIRSGGYGSLNLIDIILIDITLLSPPPFRLLRALFINTWSLYPHAAAYERPWTRRLVASVGAFVTPPHRPSVSSDVATPQVIV